MLEHGHLSCNTFFDAIDGIRSMVRSVYRFLVLLRVGVCLCFLYRLRIGSLEGRMVTLRLLWPRPHHLGEHYEGIHPLSF